MTNVTSQNDTIDIKDASQLYTNALVELDNGTEKEFANVVAVNDDSVTFNPAPHNSYYEGQKVRVLEASVNVRMYAADGSITTQESFSNLRLSYEADTAYLVNNVNRFSNLVTVEVNPAGLWTDTTKKIFSNPSMFPAAANGGWLMLTGGDDAMGALSVDDFVGVDGGSGNRTGIQALEDIDDISICVVPGMWSTTVQSALVTFCETLADRFAILDPPDGLSIAGIQDFRAPFDSEYAALYYPWLVVRDPSLKQNVDVAPSAHMAGIYAQTDLDRGVYKAPANVTVAGIVQFAQDVAQREQDVLNPIGINALRYFPNRGYRVWVRGRCPRTRPGNTSTCDESSSMWRNRSRSARSGSSSSPTTRGRGHGSGSRSRTFSPRSGGAAGSKGRRRRRPFSWRATSASR